MLITSWDDYSVHNQRLADFLLKFNVPAIFFIEIEPHREGTKDQAIYQIQKLAKKGFFIGCHTWTHPSDLKVLDSVDLYKEIRQARRFLRHLTGQEIDSFCYPRGRYDEKVLQAVKEAGFTYARTTKIGDCTVEDKPFEMMTSAHVYDRKEYDGLSWLDYAKKNYKDNEFFHLWGHAWEIEQNDQWDNLEKFFQYASNKN